MEMEEMFWRNGWDGRSRRNRLIPAIAYLSSLCSQCGVTEKWNNAGLGMIEGEKGWGHAALYSFSSVYKTKESMVNVYRETSWNEVKECIDECMTLREKTNELREKWPEVQSLSLIVDSIESLMDTNLSVGQMRMAEKLEKIIVDHPAAEVLTCVMGDTRLVAQADGRGFSKLEMEESGEEAEEWEKVSDRSHSLEEGCVSTERETSRMEKDGDNTWKTLVDRVKKDCEDRAALLVFPLFNALLSDGRDEDGIVAMASDWISHSSFIDFHQRLKSIDSLAQWARIVGKETMGKELESVVAFFGQLRDKVCGKLKEIVDPIERSMKDLVKIAQYKDLNILSIKASSKKNHIQLFKLVKRLKNEGGSGINGLMDGTMDIEVWRRIDEGRDMEGFNWMDGMGKEEGIVKRAREISKDILKQRNEKLDWNCWIEMSEMIDEVRKHCGTRIEYTGDEKEMESQQGRERNSRQREVAIVIKESQGLGVNSRRGMTVNGEDLSRRSLTQLDPSNHKRKNIIRAVALARSIMIRRGMTPNEQLSTSTRGHFLGMVEYGCHWMIENEQKMDAWKIVQKEMDKFAQGLRNEMDNREEGVETLYHNDVETTVEEMDKLTDELDQLIRSLKVRLTTVPSTTYDLGDDCSSPLSRLSSSSEELPRVSKLIDEFGNMNERILHQVDILHRNGSCGIFQRSVIENASQLVESVLDEWMGRMDECKYWFDEESEVMSHILSLIISSNKRLMIRSSNGESFSLGTDAFLLFIQRLHNNSVDCNEKWNGKGMDTLSLSAFTIGDAKPQEIVSLLSSALQRLSNGHKMDNIDLVFQLLCITRDLLNECVSIHDRCTHAVAITIHRMAELGIVLMEKGYVNTIPREEKTEGGEGNEKEGEGGGMGEGKGCKDVTEEMEETGQIEGLQGDEEEENEGRDNGNNEKNDRPIEMEEDFAKDIEDVDREGESGDDNDDGEEGEDPPMDDGMGEVDDKDEEEIDPHLWDDKDKEVNEKPSMDDDNKGADEETGEMTAREDKNADMKEGEERDEVKDETNEEEKGEDDDIENMDKNDRDDMEDMDDIKGEEERRDDTGGDEVEEEQQMEIENKEVDVDENEDEDEEGENENEESEEIDENKDEDHDDSQISTQMTEELEMENKNEEKEDKKMDVGFGGSDNEDEDEGGKGERNEEERDKRDEEKGDSGREKSDDNKEGKTDKKSRKEENIEMTKKDEEDENEDNEDRERKREIMMEEDLEMEGESEIVEGNEEDGGEERMESMNRQHNDKMMMGGGSMEEAKESMKRHENKIENKKKENIQVNSKESGMEEEDEEGKECIINFNPLDLIALTDKLTKELVVGTKNETMNTMEAKEVKEQHEDQNIKCRVEWERIAPVVSILAAELSENLRLILEPRLATRMEGDYRTGKRLNMKKIIPYIASEYRKNRIWMRRTKKADRNYQVLIAVDDSASMAENGMETLTCQGVCIVEEALRRVNAGQLSVITFGETIEQLFPFSHASSTQSTGESLLSSLSFNQSSTDMCEMLRKACSLLEEVFTPKSEQMLIIISDGRGALANGVDKIRTQLSHLSRVSVLFVILDCGKKSIRDMRVASFVDDQVELIPYLSLFPFPLYVLAQSNTQIPSLLAEALRQWIEYGSQHSN
ncbi:hypothetical protein PRIPAC_91469 [Pristionchus pacificus]|uniref:VWFA domain-containing protein n=1 Tax=Pristionchus pacificus TaxID=54126 RepID=A0A2A6BW30_PRIPA|nr:hypothetical protein PRIPAC_91469 [Pristionchus pacificus]|eukprot:PDM70095.1 hypothetical protein PRIPAC_49307 [Pristionchus pacificus]